MKERRGKVNQHTPGGAPAISTRWDARDRTRRFTKEDEHGGII